MEVHFRRCEEKNFLKIMTFKIQNIDAVSQNINMLTKR